MSAAYRSRLWTYETLCRDLDAPVADATLADTVVIGRVELSHDLVGPGVLYCPFDVAPEKQPEMVRRALEGGASAALTSAPPGSFPPGTPVVHVEKVKPAVRRLCDISRARFPGDLIAVTGSVGKTTTKDMVAQMLSYFGPTHSTLGNYNEHYGVMKTVASISPRAPYSVVEVCSSMPGSVEGKAKYVMPTVGVVTNVGHSHGVNFASRYEILRDKVSLLDPMVGRKAAVVDRDVIEFDRSRENLLESKAIDRLISVGSGEQDTVRLLDVQLSATRTRAIAEVDGRRVSFMIPAPGRHFAVNGLFSLGVALSLGLDVEEAADGFVNFQPPVRRGERIRVRLTKDGPTAEVIDDAYNSSPASVKALLESLAARAPRRKLLIFGDMLALGDEAAQLHEELADSVANANLDLFVAVGPLSKVLGQRLEGRVPVRYFDTAEELKPKLTGMVQPGDLVAFKASHGMEFYPLVRTLAVPGRSRRAPVHWTIEMDRAA